MMSGDSVTDCGRGYPYGEYRYGTLGSGYVNKLHEIVSAAYPEKEIKIVNSGISGETSRQVKARWASDLKAVKPDYATLMIGVNDVWRHYDAYMDKEIAVDIDEYESNVRSILDESKLLKGIMLISPIYFELNKQDEFMKQITAYSCVCKKLADEYANAVFFDLQPTIDSLISKRYAISFSPDRVHPGAVAHMAIANAILKSLNFRF